MLFSGLLFKQRLFILLLPTALLVWQLQADADQESEESHPTALGEPAWTAVQVEDDNIEPPAPDNQPLFPASVLDNYAFLPVIANHALVSEVQRVVELVNAERSAAGCGPLEMSVPLTSAAQGHSQDMALNDFFSHTSSDGRSPWDRIRETGYRFSLAAENIAAGYMSADSAVAAWMNSDGHRANILNCRLEETGVGYFYLRNDTGQVTYRTYWTQVFAAPLD